MHNDHNQGPKPSKKKVTAREEGAMSCPVCGLRMHERELAVYQYRESGLENIVLHGGVVEATCPDSHERLLAVQSEPQLLQVIALALLMRPGFLRAKEIRYARETCEITQAELARSMRLARRETIAEWENEKAPRRDLASEFLLRAVLLAEFKQALESRVPNHLTPSHFDLLHSFQEAFAQAYDVLLSGDQKKREKIQLRRSEKGVWAPELNAA